MKENKYCGPFVVSRVAGIPTREATALMRTISGRSQIHGSHWIEVAGAIAASIGIDIIEEGGRAIKQRVCDWAPLHDDGAYWVVAISGHYIAIRRPSWSNKLHVFDTLNPSGVPLSKYARCGSYVQRALRVKP